MYHSLSEFKFFQSFRIPVESSDEVVFQVEVERDLHKLEYLQDVRLSDISFTGIGFHSPERLSVGKTLLISFQYKRLRVDISAHVVRAFSSELGGDYITYGVEVEKDDRYQMKRFLEQYINSFSPDRARDCLVQLALKERFSTANEGFEMFSLLLSLFKDITQFGNKEQFVESMLEEVTRILNAQRASIFLINPETNELEAYAALGGDKEVLKFDYRKGIAGSVFTTGISLNIDAKTDHVRFSPEMDKVTGFSTRSIICHPISNREDKVVGVLEVLNKRNQDRFTVDDEKTMKVLGLIFSSVFHNYNPISEKSLIRRFSTPYDREYAILGRSQYTNELRRAIVRLKDIDAPLLISGPIGCGKQLLGRIVHGEGKRGHNSYHVVDCQGRDENRLREELFGEASCLVSCQGGSVLFREISFMPLSIQEELLEVLKSRRVPGHSTVTVDLRAIFTSSKDLGLLSSEAGEFNHEMLEYIGQSMVQVEPLKKRPKDLDELTEYFLKKECKKQGLLLKELSPSVVEAFHNYDWPGNVRELEETIRKAILYNPKNHVITNIDNEVLPVMRAPKKSIHALDEIPFAGDHDIALKDRVTLIERELIMDVIAQHKGNKSQAAKSMGISREALRKKLLAADEVLSRLKSQSVQDANEKDTPKAA